jgi:hypothetical protein
MPAQRPLGLGSCLHGSAGAREDVEEGVTLRVDLFAAVPRKRLPQDPPMLGQHVAVAIAELFEQPRGALDVREQEGDGAAVELSRKATPTSG